MSGLADAIAKHQAASRKGPRCTVSKLLADIDDEADRAELAAAIDNTDLSLPVVSGAIKDVHGVTVGPHTIGNHRRRQCQCRVDG